MTDTGLVFEVEKSEWKQTGNNQRAKFYGLTAGGRKQLAAEQAKWNRMNEAIQRLMNPVESEPSA